MKKTKIGYYCADVNPNKTKSLGIYKATREILKQLLKDKKFEVTLILSEDSKNFFKEFVCQKKICNSSGKYAFDKLFKYPNFANKIATKENLDILFFPKGHIPFLKTKGVRCISIIHDLIPMYYLRKGKLSMLISSFLLWWSAKFSDLIFTDSEYSMRQINKISRKLVVVIPLGYSGVKNPIKPNQNKDYIFVIGNRNPHKNLDKAIALIRDYNRVYNKSYDIKTSSGSLSEEELAGLYKYAKFSIFLSDIEGFGLPLIESYFYGTPVVFNNKTSLAEIGRGLPGACDVNEKKSVFNAITEVENLNQKRVARIGQELGAKYNWKSCVAKISKNI